MDSVQLGVLAVACQQVVVRTHLDQPGAVQHHDQIGHDDATPLRHQQTCDECLGDRRLQRTRSQPDEYLIGRLPSPVPAPGSLLGVTADWQ